mgnify:CR=1 FL=1
MKKVLFITYNFPPQATGGVFRSLYFAKHLRQHGWEPTILTVSAKNSWTQNDKLLEDFPGDIKIHRAYEFDPLYLHVILSKLNLNKVYDFVERKFFIPDKRAGWIPFAVRKGKQILIAEKFDLIFSTSPSVSAHKIASKLSGKFKFPWICEFRDLWTLMPHYAFNNSKRGIIENTLEKEFVENSERVIVVTQSFKERFAAKYAEIPPNKFHVIYNGFEEFNPVEAPDPHEELTIVYTGSMYGEYYPGKLFEVVRQLQESDLEMKIKFIFIGNVEHKIQTKLKSFAVIPTEFHGFMNKMELQKILKQADAFLLFQLGNYASVPSKVFEYLSYQKPILAVIHDEELKDIVNTTGMGYCAHKHRDAEIKNAVVQLYEDWQRAKLPRAKNLKALSPFRREFQCEQLAEIFNEVA